MIPTYANRFNALLRTISLDSRAFVSPPKFIKSDLPSGPTCLVLYVRLPGLDLWRQRTASQCHVPIIFITGHADVAVRIADFVIFTRCWEFASGQDPVACKMVTSSWPAFCGRLLQGDLVKSCRDLVARGLRQKSAGVGNLGNGVAIGSDLA